jgi:hypothetical protein
MCAGAPSTVAVSSRVRSSSLSASGAYFEPSASFAIVSAAMPRSRLSMPRTTARGVSADISQALDERRRNAS